MGAAQRVVFGPNDFHMAAGVLEPGLGPEEEKKIRQMRFGGAVEEDTPDKAALKKRAEELKATARQLSIAERELEKERLQMQDSLAEREAKVAEREALVAKQLEELEGGGHGS